jgi:hypothetical protein
MSTGYPSLNADDRLERELRRLERLLRFAADQERALRDEYGLPAQGAPAGAGQAVAALAGKLDQVAAAAAKLQQVMREAEGKGGTAGLEHLRTGNERQVSQMLANLPALSHAAKREHGDKPVRRPAPTKGTTTGRAAPPRPAAAPTGPLPGPPGASLTSRLTAMLNPAVQGAEAPLQQDEANRRRLRHLGAVLKLAKAVLSYAGPRLAAVASALGTAERHGTTMGPLELGHQASKDAEVAGVIPQWRLMVPRLVRLNVNHGAAPRVQRTALKQYDNARTTDFALQRLATEAETRPAALEKYDPTGSAAAIMPLTRLPQTFRDLPCLNEMFPVPMGRPALWEAWQRELEGIQLVPAAAPAPPPPPPPPAPTEAAAPGTERIDAAAQVSKERRDLLAAYEANPNARLDFKDHPLMFRMAAVEHAYQVERATELKEQLLFLQEGRKHLKSELEREIALANERAAQMEALKRRIARHAEENGQAAT